METGRIGDYFWYDLGEMPLRDTLRLLAPSIIGLKAVNTSFDSGLLSPRCSEFPAGWSTWGNVAISPVVTRAMVPSWPLSHDEYCDEWWFFREVPANFDARALCNFIANHIRDWETLEFEGGLELARNIARFRPELIVGNHQLTYCVSRNPLTFTPQ